MWSTRLTHWLTRLSIAAAIVAVTRPVHAQNPGITYEVVSSFDGIAVNGSSPDNSFIQGSDGNFYGTASGGLFARGTVFRIDSAGVLTILHHFSGADGAVPVAGVIQATDGSLYGTTNAGGAFNAGTIFRIDAAGVLTTLHHFSFDDDGGTQPTVLIQGNEGTIFGVTAGVVSTVFRLNPGGGITTLHRFDQTEGFSPGALIQAADGSLYGTVRNGGPGGDGTVFKLDTSGTLTTLHAFSGPDGSFPVQLIQGSDGDFYGVTGEGLSPNQFGTIFKIDAAGTFTSLHRFDPGIAASVLIQGNDGGFYGQTWFSIFRFDPGGTPTTLLSFTGNDAISYGGLIQASDGRLYGTKSSGGTAPGQGGMFFTLDLAGTLTVLHNFGRGPGPARPVAPVIEASDGRLYGTTAAGGLTDLGTVFTIEPSGAPTILHNFTDRDDGSAPAAGLVQATDGVFYGTTSTGGRPGGTLPGNRGLGTVFAIDAAGTLTTRHVFPFLPFGNGATPNGVIQATDGRLYGTTNSTVFSLPLSGPATTLATFSGDSDAALIEASDGTFFGTTRLGGGAIFSVNTAGSLTARHAFGGADGRAPRSRVIEGLDGSLYGTTSEAGAFGFGTVFKFEPTGTLTTLYHFAGADGANPYAGLLQASDGRFYGTTRNGGAFGYGTIFSIDAAGTLATLHSFSVSDGGFPAADLIQASDGHLYGTTEIGGPGGGGVVFRVRFATSTPDQYFEVVSRNSDKCLDVFGASTDPATPVIQWICHGGANQQWRLEPAGGGAFRIIARHSGQALDVYGALLDDITPIIQFPVHGGDNQVWTLEPASDGYVRIVARHSGKAMDVELASTEDGARVIQYTPHGGANQQWLLRPVE